MLARQFVTPRRSIATLVAVSAALTAAFAVAADWRQFRGPGGLATSDEKGLPVKWSAKENIVWRTELPGPGTSSPVTVGDRVFVTCYSGYAVDDSNPGDMNNLKRHLVSVDRNSGRILWQKQFDPRLPEHQYAGEGAYHGYSSSTPASDGERLYVFFGKSGVYCLDLRSDRNGAPAQAREFASRAPRSNGDRRSRATQLRDVQSRQSQPPR